MVFDGAVVRSAKGPPAWSSGEGENKKRPGGLRPTCARSAVKESSAFEGDIAML